MSDVAKRIYGRLHKLTSEYDISDRRFQEQFLVAVDEELARPLPAPVTPERSVFDSIPDGLRAALKQANGE